MNYRHLQYFWTVAREGSLAAASKTLNVTPQALSEQIKVLEARWGVQLLLRSGRGVIPTEQGLHVLAYADQIFAIGGELEESLRHRKVGLPQPTLRVGIAQSVPKSLASKVLHPDPAVGGRFKLVCTEGTVGELLALLAVHRLDLIISDTAVPPDIRVKAFSHPLGKCGVSFFASRQLLERTKLPRQAKGQGKAEPLAQLLGRLPLLVPGTDSVLRGRLDKWLDAAGVRPVLAGEYDDTALMKAMGADGLGAFPAPSAIAAEICKQYAVEHLGVASGLTEELFALSADRRIRHPAVSAITSSAKKVLGV